MEILIEFDPTNGMMKVMSEGKLAYADFAKSFDPSPANFKSLFDKLGCRTYVRKTKIQTNKEIDEELSHDEFLEREGNVNL